jgi:hypothetical protein
VSIQTSSQWMTFLWSAEIRVSSDLSFIPKCPRVSDVEVVISQLVPRL